MQVRAADDLEATLAVAQVLGHALMLIGPDYVVRVANERAARLTGLTLEEIMAPSGLHTHFNAALATDGRTLPTEQRPVWRCLHRGERIERERVGFRRNERVGWLTITCLPIADPHNPERRAAIVLFDDVTRQTDSELELRHAQAVLASAFDASPLAMVVADHDGRIVEANAAFNRLSPLSGPGRSRLWWSFIDPHDRSELFEQLEALAAGGCERLSLECRGTDAAGQPVVVQISGAPVEQTGTLPSRLSVQITDVTELRQSEIRFRTLTAAVPVGIFELDRTGCFTYVTPLMAQITGADDLLGRSAQEFIHPLDQERARQLFHRALEGESWSIEQRVVTRSGRELTALTVGRPIVGPGGRIDSIIGTLHDLTEHAKLQVRLSELDRDFESLAAQQARERLEAQLAQAQRFETMGRLAGGVAHDFNNLLGVISNYAGFLAKRRDLPEALRHDVDQISEAARRGAELTRQLLLFSRREQLRPQRFDLSRVLGELGAMMTRPLRPAIELTIDAEPDTVIEADQGQIEQMVLNLLINARDALPRGGTIEVTARTMHDVDGRHVLLEVVDNGTGMPPEVCARIFEPFFTTKPRSEASGLGMATVQGIIEQAGGTVSVASTPGEGTTVSVRLPC